MRKVQEDVRGGCAQGAAWGLTQVHVGGLGSLGVRAALVDGVQQLLLHLHHRVAVQTLDRHLRPVLVLRVHAVQRLEAGQRVSWYRVSTVQKISYITPESVW